MSENRLRERFELMGISTQEDRDTLYREVMQWHKAEMLKIVPDKKDCRFPKNTKYDYGKKVRAKVDGFNACRDEILKRIEGE